MKTLRRFPSSFVGVLLLVLCAWTTSYAQITPSGDAYTNTTTPTTNLGTKPLLDVESGAQTTYIQFDLSSIPTGYTSASIAKATLKMYVNAVTAAGSFNVDYVNGTWSEKTITASVSPALGTTIVGSVPLTSANVHDYIRRPAVRCSGRSSRLHQGSDIRGSGRHVPGASCAHRHFRRAL